MTICEKADSNADDIFIEIILVMLPQQQHHVSRLRLHIIIKALSIL